MLGFEVGDMVAMPNSGLARVTDLVTKEIAGMTERFYQLEHIGRQRTSLIPLTLSAELGLRRPLTSDGFDALLQELREPTCHENDDNQDDMRALREAIDCVDAERIARCLAYSQHRAIRDVDFRTKSEIWRLRAQRRLGALVASDLDEDLLVIQTKISNALRANTSHLSDQSLDTKA